MLHIHPINMLHEKNITEITLLRCDQPNNIEKT